MTPRHSMKLSDAPLGKRVRINRLRSRPEIRIRLREMGVREDAVVCCVMKSHGNIICEILSMRIAMNSRLAGEIMVSIPE
jgi:Fe2+ transport system protein FeoA